MDFFTELLKSFSRKHDRKLRLLEQVVGAHDPEAEALAKQALAQGSQQSAQESFNNPITTPNGNQIYIWKTTKGKVNYNYQPIAFPSFGVDANYDKFVASFKKDAEVFDPEKEKEEKLQQKEEKEREDRRKSVLTSDMAKQNPEIVGEIVDNVNEFDQAMTDLLCTEDGSINPDYMDQVQFAPNATWSNCKPHLQFLRGNQVGNVERQLINNVPVLRFDGKTGKYFVDSEPAVASQALEISRALNVLAKAAAGDESAKEEACNRFKVTEGGGLKGVTVYTEVDSEGRGLTGRVFNNEASARSLKGLMGMAGCSMEPQSATKAVAAGSAGAESNIRGTLGEIAKVFGTDLTNLVKMKAAVGKGVATPEIEALQDIVLERSKEVLDLLGNLNEQRESWIDKSQGAVVGEEEQAELEAISEIVGDKEKTMRFMTAILTMAATTSKLRDPLVTVQVAEQVGGGDKQDVLECWGSREEALAGLRKSEEYDVDGETRSRVTEEDIGEASASEVFKNNPELLDKYIKAGVIKSKDQMLYTSEVSLKTLLRLSSAKQGETTRRKVSETIIEGVDARAQNFNKKVSGKDQASIRKIQRDIDSVDKLVGKLSSKVNVKTENGVITQNSLNSYAETLVNHIVTNSTFDEVKDNVDLAELQEYIKSMKSDDPKMTDKKFEAKIKDKIFKMTAFSRIEKMAAQGGDSERKAALHALALFNVAGGSARDNTVFQVDALDEMASYVSTQNGEMQSALDSIKSGDGRWKFQPSKGSLTFSYADDPNRTISVTYKDGKWIAYRSATSIKNASTRNKAIGEEDRQDSSTIWTALNTLQEALGIIKEKVRVLDAD
tara:strand:+ start:3392 stop:5899 length:2508 start_codon:yes stop_codon:yes gene_type:complete